MALKVPWTTAPSGQADGVLITQYYSLASGAILFYDYFLTLPDEVRREDHPKCFPTEPTTFAD